MDFPTHLKFSKDHEWVNPEKDEYAYVGVTAYALEQLGDIVHIELPEVGDDYDTAAPFGTIESTKTVSDLYMPISGSVAEVNENLLSNLESLGEDPYKEGWLVKIKINNSAEISSLMDSNGYESFIGEQEG